MLGLSIPRIAELVRPLLRLPVVYKNTADSTAITGATEADTIFDTYHTVPANTLRAGSIIRCHAIGQHTATTGSESNTTQLKVGTVSIASTGVADPADNDIFVFNYEIIIRTIGAGGTLTAQGYRIHGASGTGTARPTLLGSTTIDTTGALTVGVWMDRQTTATDSDSAVLRTITVEVVY